MYFISLLMAISIGHAAFSPQHPLKVAVIDTGLDLSDPRFKDHLCPSGHESFVGPLKDNMGHSTHITGLILNNAPKDHRWCLVVLKWYNSSLDSGNDVSYLIKAYKKAIQEKVNIINYSGGGPLYSPEERRIIEKNPETTFVVAAGNDGLNLSKGFYYFPASLSALFKNIIPVGNHSDFSGSNYGLDGMKWENGQNILSTLPNNKLGIMSGTSQSTAIYTGKLITRMLNE